jgi:uncharacterized protein (DUF302 family)
VPPHEPLSVLLPEPMRPAEEKVRAALAAHGFGVLTEIDVQATLRAKLGTEFYPYRLLGVCNPALAYRALGIDPSLGTFLPCTIAIYDTGSGTEVHVQDPALALRQQPMPGLAELVLEVRARLEQVIAQLSAAETPAP